MEFTDRPTTADSRYHIKAKRTIFMRVFLWVWMIEGHNLDTCKIAWGTLLLPIGLVLNALMHLAYAISVLSRKRSASKQTSPPDPEAEQRRRKAAAARYRRREARLERFATTMGVVWMRIYRPVTVLAGLIAFGAVAFAVYVAVTDFAAIWPVIRFVLIVIGFAIVLITLTAIFTLMDNRKKRRSNHGLLRRAFHSVHTHTCAVVELED